MRVKFIFAYFRYNCWVIWNKGREFAVKKVVQKLFHCDGLTGRNLFVQSGVLFISIKRRKRNILGKRHRG